MEAPSQKACIAFAGTTCIASGPVTDVACAVKQVIEGSADVTILIFDATTSEPVEIDFRGTADDVVARLGAGEPETVPAPRSPGRPKLGVVAREVTLLPRHWEWLATQPGGASVTLRKLVESARKQSSAPDRKRAAQEATYRFALVMAGNEPGFEESMRALYAGDNSRFQTLTEAWPADVRSHARELAAEAFVSEGE